MRGTPSQVGRKLRSGGPASIPGTPFNTALRAPLADKETVEGLALMRLAVKSSTPAELTAMLKADTERRGPIVKSIGFTAES